MNAKTLLKIAEQLRSDIKLFDDEITAILFTSLDHEFLPDLLCLPGEILEWFLIDFSDDTTAESDFIETKIELWESTVSLANQLLNEAK